MTLPAPELELRQLRAFLVVAETRHFGRAAERLGIAQPPLSQQIRRLESRVGHPLFERHARGVMLTAAGRELLPAARSALDQVSSGLDAARRAGLGQAGRLRIGFAASLAFTLLPKVVGAYRARFPGVTLDLRELTSTPQMEALRAGTLDAGFVRETPPEPDLVSIPVLHERLVAVLPRAHPLTAQRQVPVAALAEEPFVLFPPAEGPAFHARILRVCADAGFTPHIAQQAVEWQTLVAFVEAGLGVTIAPAGVARIRLRGVAFRRLSPDPEPCVVALCRQAGEPSPLLSAFVAAVVS
ncbi:LysR substrate-binding domain-containing protein [Actinomadura rudentiformis]|uniref:LysR substrate-binding domain-containing protein n=1 Tax=Actinomadura rudentiformis TaxID=359158 RepID=UPI001CEF7A3C|nr:LysR substrate-binding domain-containing protein [Actinomadura rudentiformis]